MGSTHRSATGSSSIIPHSLVVCPLLHHRVATSLQSREQGPAFQLRCESLTRFWYCTPHCPQSSRIFCVVPHPRCNMCYYVDHVCFKVDVPIQLYIHRMYTGYTVHCTSYQQSMSSSYFVTTDFRKLSFEIYFERVFEYIHTADT